MNAQIVTFANGSDWVTFSTVKDSEMATMFNSAGEKQALSLDSARGQTRDLVKTGWTLVRIVSLRTN